MSYTAKNWKTGETITAALLNSLEAAAAQNAADIAEIQEALPTYVGSEVTKKAAAAYTPTTSNQTIAANQYLTGAQTIRGDANLKAANIKSGVSVFGVAGTYTGTGSGTTTPTLQSKTVTPAASAQTVTPDSGYDGLSQVTVSGDSDLTAANIKSGVNIFGVTGTYSGTSSTPALQSKTVTPTKSAQSVTPDSGYDGLSKVTVNAIPASYVQPSGTRSITANGTYDVTSYASAEVAVPTSGSGVRTASGALTGAGEAFTIETGLTSISAILIYNTGTLSSTGLMVLAVVNEVGRVGYCSSYSSYMKMHSVASCTAFSISGGTFEYTESGASKLPPAGVEYAWTAVGT